MALLLFNYFFSFFPFFLKRAKLIMWSQSAKQGNYLVPLFNVFGMIRFLTGNWTQDLLHSTTKLSMSCPVFPDVLWTCIMVPEFVDLF